MDSAESTEQMHLLPPVSDRDPRGTDSEYEEKLQWIESNIKIRKCIHYIPANTTSDICKCGYTKDNHEHNDNTNTSTEMEWKLDSTDSFGVIKFETHETQQKRDHERNDETNTSIESETNAFGETKVDTHGENVAEFVRVDIETKRSKILELMQKVWKMKKPNLLISVTGGDYYSIPPQLKDTFHRNLVEAASNTDAWIITGGTHYGVMKRVGEAVQKQRLTSGNQESVIAIGIAPWGVIQNRDFLKGNKLSKPAIYRIEETQKRPDETFLDPNHRYFILVDDGTLHNFATEICFRAELEREISNMPASQTEGIADRISLGSVESAVPTVIIVLGGGPIALKTVKTALEKNTPAVIIKGSGGAADLLAYTLKNARKVEIDKKGDIKRTEKHISEEVEAKIRKRMKDIGFCNSSDDQVIGDYIERIKACIAKFYLIHIFKWNSDNLEQDLRMAILKALLKANTKQPKDTIQQPKDKHWTQLMDRLGLALVWGMSDMLKIAKSEIFTENQSTNRDTLKNIMLLAIMMNRANFVELFLDKEIRLNEVLTVPKLLQLYNQVFPTSFLKKMWQEKNQKVCNTITFDEVGQLIQDLVGDYYKVDRHLQEGERDEKCKNPERELLIWSVLNNHQETAELFWRRGKDAIAAALVASALYSAMSHRTNDKELQKQFTENANKFTDLANGVLQECNSTDEKKTQQLLLQEVKDWGEISCIEIAIKAKNMEFISQNACQVLFQCIWKGKEIQENGTPRMKGQPNQDPDNHNGTVINDGTGHGTENKVKSSSVWGRPVFAFYFHMISYIIFLGLYSFFLISKLEKKFSVEEAILITWVITICFEEIRQACTKHVGKSKLRTYIKDGWNQIDVITISLFVIGMILRGIPCPQALEAARIVLGVNLVTFFTRLLHIFCAYKEIGPKLEMIVQTLKNLPYFFVILMVINVAYAIASYAILYPNTELSLDTFIAIFRRPYWNIYGDLMLDEIEGDVDCTLDAELYRNGTHFRCPTVSGKYFVPVIMGVYMLMCNILLLNLLIVMFGEEYEKVKNKVDMHWNLQLLSLIHEYYSRPIVPPPFIVIEHVYWLIKRKCDAKTGKRAFYRKYNENVCQFEKDTAYKFHSKRTQRGQNDKQSKDLRVKKLVDEMDILQKQQQTVTETIDDFVNGQKRLEKYMEEQENQMKKQMQLIEESLMLLRRVKVTDA